MTLRRVLGGLILLLATGVGVLVLLLPFLMPGSVDAGSLSALLLSALAGLALLALLIEAQGGTSGTKTIALLGVLVAINAVLRFVETALPGPGGFSPIFFLILLTGYVFGGRFGFLMGALTLLVSALITGGVGPWLPFQMLVAGWVGLSAGGVRALHSAPGRGALGWLVVLGLFWGLAYGAFINLWFWPFAIGPVGEGWEPGLGAGEALARYALFYAATSLGWDLLRAAGNVALLLFFGAPTLRTLERFRCRFDFSYQPEPGESAS